MRGYLNTILLLSIIIGIISSFISDINNGTKKYVNYLMGLIMVITILMPFRNIATGILNIKEYINDFLTSIKTEQIIDESNSVIINSSKENISNGLKNALISKFGFSEKDIYVIIDTDETEISAIKLIGVNIILTNNASWANVDEVQRYMENLVGVRVSVTRK